MNGPDILSDLRAQLTREVGSSSHTTPDPLPISPWVSMSLLQKAMGSEQLRVIAHEIVEQMRGSVTVDWHHKSSARARMRVLVKRILKKYGYPPDLEQEGIQTVLAQAEVMLREVTAGAASSHAVP